MQIHHVLSFLNRFETTLAYANLAIGMVKLALTVSQIIVFIIITYQFYQIKYKWLQYTSRQKLQFNYYERIKNEIC